MGSGIAPVPLPRPACRVPPKGSVCHVALPCSATVTTWSGPLTQFTPGALLDGAVNARRVTPLSAMCAVAVMLIGALLASCTDDSALRAGDRSTIASDAPRDEPGSGTGPLDCEPPLTTTPLDVTPLGGRDFDMVSFDETRIRLHWLPHPDATPQEPHPTVLMGPGWSLGGTTGIDDSRILGGTSTRSLHDAGYNILTWDPRGFGLSDGTAMVDSAEFEGRDVQQMIDWVATRPEVVLDAERDPRMAMVGGSYGGGIALVGAAIDCRVDAVVAVAAWHSLESSLYRADTVKIGWVRVLVEAAFGHSLDGHIESAMDSATLSGGLSDDERRWFIERGPGSLINDIRVPVLLIQGTVDTLFTLDEAIANYQILERNGIEVAMLWNCDGHGLCLTEPGDEMRATVVTIDWLNRHVRGDRGIPQGPGFEVVDQNGERHVADRYVSDIAGYLSGSGAGRLALTDTGGADAVDDQLTTGLLLASIASDITPGRAENAVEVTVEADRNVMIIGAPLVDVSYKGQSPRSVTDDGSGAIVSPPARVFAQLIDERTGLVIGNQSTPIPLVLDGRPQRISVALESIAFTTEPGSRLTLQLTPYSVAYAVPLMGPTIEFSKVDLRLPVVDWLRAVPVASDTP